jgi:hypothetical protein
MVPHVFVRPARKGQAAIHPRLGRLPDEGAQWPDDQDTKRLIVEGTIRVDEPDQPPADAAPAQPKKDR